MTDEERAAAICNLCQIIGPIFDGAETETVVGALAALLGDVLNCYPVAERLDVAAGVAGRALNFSAALESKGFGQPQRHKRTLQ